MYNVFGRLVISTFRPHSFATDAHTVHFNILIACSRSSFRMDEYGLRYQWKAREAMLWRMVLATHEIWERFCTAPCVQEHARLQRTTPK